MEALLEPLLHSPRLARYRDEIDRVLAAEHERRERFYDEIEPNQKAEFINGEVIMHSPAKAKHVQITGRILNLLSNWSILHESGSVFFEKALVCLTRNDYEPDVLYYGPEKAAVITPDQMKFPAPDFIIEVLSESTEKYDRTVKFTDYADHGVEEYWIVDPDERTIEQYGIGPDGIYALHSKLDATHQIKSRRVDGFAMPVIAAFDDVANLAALREMLSVK